MVAAIKRHAKTEASGQGDLRRCRSWPCVPSRDSPEGRATRMTIQSQPPEDSPQRRTSPWDSTFDRLVRLAEPTIYAKSWVPWLRLVLSAVVVVGLILVLRA
jgi:hypothetical protein